MGSIRAREGEIPAMEQIPWLKNARSGCDTKPWDRSFNSALFSFVQVGECIIFDAVCSQGRPSVFCYQQYESDGQARWMRRPPAPALEILEKATSIDDQCRLRGFLSRQ